jgi:hypothetical protein
VLLVQLTASLAALLPYLLALPCACDRAYSALNLVICKVVPHIQRCHGRFNCIRQQMLHSDGSHMVR